MSVLLSVKPKYVTEMIQGNKKYEFRRSIWRANKKIRKVYIYSSSPIKKIIGIFTIKDIIEDNPSNLWIKFGEFSGIREDEFFSYFKSSKKAFAIEIDTIEVFKKPIDPFQEFSSFKPPQSFYYINENVLFNNVLNLIW